MHLSIGKTHDPTTGKYSDTGELSEDSKYLWDKMLIFKQRFKDQESRFKLLEESLSKVNLELSRVKNENSRLNEKLEEQRSSINKYQQILKDLVEVEDRYCKLIVEKKKTDAELSSEKKLRLELQNKWNSEKAELQKSLHNELHTLKEHAASEENSLKNEYSNIIEELKLENKSLNDQVSEAHKKQEEGAKVKQDLMKAQREISRLRNRLSGQEKLTIVNNVTLKPIVQEGPIGTRIQAGEDSGGVEMTASKSLEYIFEEPPVEEDEDFENCRQNQQLIEVPRHTTARHSIPSKEQIPLHFRMNSTQRNKTQPEGTYVANYKQHDSEPLGGRKCNALEVFRVPSRIQTKSPLKKKRKLYSRSDDTI